MFKQTKAHFIEMTWSICLWNKREMAGLQLYTSVAELGLVGIFNPSLSLYQVFKSSLLTHAPAVEIYHEITTYIRKLLSLSAPFSLSPAISVAASFYRVQMACSLTLPTPSPKPASPSVPGLVALIFIQVGMKLWFPRTQGKACQ